MGIEELVGKTIKDIRNVEGEQIWIELEDGSEYEMSHGQDCCESVQIEDVVGDLTDLIGSPLLIAEESSNSDDASLHEYHESWTWTYYKFATIKGSVSIRWYGTSNGYYSESVLFRKVQ